MRTLLSIFLVVLVFTSCSNNSSQQKTGTILNQDTVKAKRPVYISKKVQYKYNGHWDDTIVYVNKSKVNVSISNVCQGDYTLKDTSCDNDTCWVSLYREQVIHIKIMSPEEHQVTIDKALLKQKAGDIDLSNGLLSVTNIDSVDNINNKILFGSDIAFNSGDMIIHYTIDLKGKFEFVDHDFFSGED